MEAHRAASYAATVLGAPELTNAFSGPLRALIHRLWYAPAPPPPANPPLAPTKPPTQAELAEELQKSVEESAWAPAAEEELFEVDHVRALLLELIRRAAHDWVLYRSSSRLAQKELAHDAYVWLFEEGPDHPWWKLRQAEGRALTSFLSVCEQLDIDPEYVRDKVQLLTARGIKMAGRPAERRRKKEGYESSYYFEHSVEMVSLEDLDE